MHTFLAAFVLVKTLKYDLKRLCVCVCVKLAIITQLHPQAPIPCTLAFLDHI